MSNNKQTRSKNESQIMKDKTAERQSCRRQMKDKYKSVDYFGQTVNLKWNGEETYKTMIGASLSWIILVIMLAYTSYRLFYMVNRLNPTVTRTTLVRGAGEDEPYTPTDSGFSFAFGL